MNERVKRALLYNSLLVILYIAADYITITGLHVFLDYSHGLTIANVHVGGEYAIAIIGMGVWGDAYGGGGWGNASVASVNFAFLVFLLAVFVNIYLLGKSEEEHSQRPPPPPPTTHS